jgi:hypothetical protein
MEIKMGEYKSREIAPPWRNCALVGAFLVAHFAKALFTMCGINHCTRLAEALARQSDDSSFLSA